MGANLGDSLNYRLIDDFNGSLSPYYMGDGFDDAFWRRLIADLWSGLADVLAATTQLPLGEITHGHYEENKS